MKDTIGVVVNLLVGNGPMVEVGVGRSYEDIGLGRRCLN